MALILKFQPFAIREIAISDRGIEAIRNLNLKKGLVHPFYVFIT